MIDNFHQGVRDLGPVWKDAIRPQNLQRVQEIAGGATHAFPDDLWASVVYDFALAYRRRVMSLEHLLKSLTPLYLGRTAAFVLDTAESDSDEVEEKIEALAKAYESEKAHFVGRWQAANEGR